MRAWLAAADAGRTVLAVLSDAVVRFNSLPPEAARAHRQRMSLILHVPALQAHSNLRYAAWRAVVAEYAARRTGPGPAAALPQLVAPLPPGAAAASYEPCLADTASDLSPLMPSHFPELSPGFSHVKHPRHTVPLQRARGGLI